MKKVHDARSYKAVEFILYFHHESYHFGMTHQISKSHCYVKGLYDNKLILQIHWKDVYSAASPTDLDKNFLQPGALSTGDFGYDQVQSCYRRCQYKIVEGI